MFVEPPRLLAAVMASVCTLLSLEFLVAVALLSFYLSVYEGLNDGKRRLDLIPELAYESVFNS